PVASHAPLNNHLRFRFHWITSLRAGDASHFAVLPHPHGRVSRACLFERSILMSNLIDQDRALRNLSGQSLSSDELDTLDALIAAASQAIENHCRRTIAVTTYDERHDGEDDDVLLLRHYPVTALERALADP